MKLEKIKFEETIKLTNNHGNGAPINKVFHDTGPITIQNVDYKRDKTGHIGSWQFWFKAYKE
ncbi:MAG: hypothetical protein A2X01_09195 [Bacteroidetes bacterium GWF2_35_48]|nr:MAG: hypothetical protein A2X01_09195 [Bacteroidetes bacterium GWF2_35_48]